jgi:hypothetical protein
VEYGRTARRGGEYFRLADPSWEDPLDISHSQHAGGRWNPPGAFGVLYLNATVRMARLQVVHRLAGQPYGVEDLEESEQHDLVAVTARDCDHLDCVTGAGLSAVGLPESYPIGKDGRPIGWDVCQPVGRAAYDAGRPGVACRSAAAGASSSDEELGVFDRAAHAVVMTGRRTFADWYWS